MTKKCNGCRAYDTNGKRELGYKVKVLSKNTSVGYAIEEQIPLENCPKPKTYKDLVLFKKVEK